MKHNNRLVRMGNLTQAINEVENTGADIIVNYIKKLQDQMIALKIQPFTHNRTVVDDTNINIEYNVFYYWDGKKWLHSFEDAKVTPLLSETKGVREHFFDHLDDILSEEEKLLEGTLLEKRFKLEANLEPLEEDEDPDEEMSEEQIDEMMTNGVQD